MSTTKPRQRTAKRMVRTFWTIGFSCLLIACGSDRPHDGARDGAAAKRPIIDMHMHAFTFEVWSQGTRPPHPTTGKPPEAKTSADILRLTLEAMDRYNIKIGVLSGRLETVYAWKAKAPDRFLAGAMFSGRSPS